MRLACPALFSGSEKKFAVVTPSPLLAAIAAQQAAETELAAGRDTFERAGIFSLDAWLSGCWQQARYASSSLNRVPLLLSPAQERALWQQIIEAEHPRLFDPAAAARLARRAASLLAGWQIPHDGDAWNNHEDARQFQTWLQLFRSKCREQGWITRSDLWNLVPRWMRDGLVARELTVFTGFDVLSPALNRVLQALGESVRLEPATFPKSTARHPAKCFASLPEELQYAARAARAAFERNPRHSIAVFVPDLSTHRLLVQRIFESIFYPSRALRRDPQATQSAFHLHAAAPLAEHPVVVNALLFLELAFERIDHAHAEAILRSPFITGAAAERSQRALADLDLRKKRDLDVTLHDLESASSRCPLLQPLWSTVRHSLRKMPSYAELPAWSEFMRNLLKATGWPGDLPLGVQEQEAVDQWKEALSSLSALGLVTPRVSYEAALAHLRRLLAGPQIETGDWFSPIQILDAKNAHALQFDFAILTGLSDETWPPSPEISPLIPLTLQRAHNVPGISQQSAREIRETLTRNLFRSAPALLATFSGRLSPFAAAFVDRASFEPAIWPGKTPLESFPPAAFEEQEDSQAPRYINEGVARGGASLIKAQSLCPFRAFAEFRLQARAPEDACFGFDARDRGGFVHRALQFVWQALETQQALRSAPGERLREIVQDAVTRAVDDDRSSPLHEIVSSAERERLETLILDWLQIERDRKQPFTVETIEQERDYQIDGLHLKLRIDRIDRLANGRALLIDYKTGKVTGPSLEGERPAEPQLLLYSAALADPVDGIFFGQLRPRELRAVGFSRAPQFPGRAACVKKDWDAFLSGSHREVNRIANQFVQGHAAAHPVHHACDYCGVKPLCRIRESGAAAEEQE